MDAVKRSLSRSVAVHEFPNPCLPVAKTKPEDLRLLVWTGTGKGSGLHKLHEQFNQSCLCLALILFQFSSHCDAVSDFRWKRCGVNRVHLSFLVLCRHNSLCERGLSSCDPAMWKKHSRASNRSQWELDPYQTNPRSVSRTDLFPFLGPLVSAKWVRMEWDQRSVQYHWNKTALSSWICSVWGFILTVYWSKWGIISQNWCQKSLKCR